MGVIFYKRYIRKTATFYINYSYFECLIFINDLIAAVFHLLNLKLKIRYQLFFRTFLF